IPGRLDTQRAEKRYVLGRVTQMVLAANHVSDAHLEVVNDVHQMEYRLAVGPDDHKIRIDLLAVGQFARDTANDQVGNDDWLAWHFEFDSAFVVVSEALLLQFLHAPVVNSGALRLKIWSAVAFAGSCRIAGQRPFVPFQPQPAH